MAISRPFNISLNGKTLDGNETNIVKWEVSGDIQTAYKIDIYLNDGSETLIWSSMKVTSYSLQATLPKPITNGHEYKILITAYNQSNASAVSYPVIFQTSGRPVVTVDSIDTIGSYSNSFSARYSQSEGLPLQSYIVNLYNDQKELIDHSDILTQEPLEYLFSNLETEKSYYVEFQATSEKGLIGTSGLVKFDVFYMRPKTGVSLTAKNIDNAGIELSWFVSHVAGKSNGIIGFVNNEKISLINGSSVKFDEGFSLERDFTLKVWMESLKIGVTLLYLQGTNGQLDLSFDGIEKRFVLTKYTVNYSERWKSKPITDYVFVSPYQIVDMSGDKYVITIQQIGRDLYLYVETFN
jgi:hypothetical protein